MYWKLKRIETSILIGMHNKEKKIMGTENLEAIVPFVLQCSYKTSLNSCHGVKTGRGASFGSYS